MDAFIYLDLAALTEAGIDIPAVEEFISVYCDNIEGIADAITHTDLSTGNFPNTATSERIMRSFVPERFGNVMLVPDQFWSFISGTKKYATTHGSPYTYDTYVPIFFAGAGIEPAHIKRSVGPEDIAPTLAAILGIMAPSGSTGTALHEVLEGDHLR